MGHDGGSLVAEGLAVPVHQVLDVGKVLALEGLGQEAGRLALGPLCLGKRLGQLLDVVSVDGDGVEAERLEALPVGLDVVLEGRGVRLAQPVDVDDGAQVVQLVVALKKCANFPFDTFFTKPIPRTCKCNVDVGYRRDQLRVWGECNITR